MLMVTLTHITKLNLQGIKYAFKCRNCVFEIVKKVELLKTSHKLETQAYINDVLYQQV